jgi:hypothetical protein
LADIVDLLDGQSPKVQIREDKHYQRASDGKTNQERQIPKSTDCAKNHKHHHSEPQPLQERTNNGALCAERLTPLAKL